MKSQTNTGYVAFLSVVAAIGGILFGYDTAVISGTVTGVSAQFGLDAMQQGWFVGCALVGSIGGVAVAGILSDRFGRRMTMLISAVFFTVSGIGCALSPDFTQLVIYRIIGGVGIGVVSIVSPMYISEVAVARWRGTLVSALPIGHHDRIPGSLSGQFPDPPIGRNGRLFIRPDAENPGNGDVARHVGKRNASGASLLHRHLLYP